MLKKNLSLVKKMTKYDKITYVRVSGPAELKIQVFIRPYILPDVFYPTLTLRKSRVVGSTYLLFRLHDVGATLHITQTLVRVYNFLSL